ncbi:MAG: hypothetical protein ACYTGZ_20195 [Planctomycetota bacterium]|jgi:hypothetical protein
MKLLRKILLWLVGLAVLVAVAGLIAVWAVLGVNPFEADQKHLWQLTSYQVNFFVRFPGTGVLEDPFVESLEMEPGYEGLAKLKDDLRDVTLEVARQTAGQLPLGQEVDFEKDFLGKEMAIAGTVTGDYRRPRVDHFILLTRIAPYAKFLSALKRGFVRSKIPDGSRIELVKGLYFRIKVDAKTKESLDQFRSMKGGMGPRDEIFVARIRDVLVISDNSSWVEDALEGHERVLPADAWFESEFIRTSRGGPAAEAFVRWELSAHAFQTHARDQGSLLYALEKIVPTRMTGDLTIRLESEDESELNFSLSNLPNKESFGKIARHLREIYDSEKVDIRTELGNEGIGRFIPKRRVVGAMVLRADAEHLVDVLMTLLPASYLELFDEEVRKSSKNRWPSFERLLRHVCEDLGDTHLMVFHRPIVFDKAPWDQFEDPFDAPITPRGQMSVSLVSRVKDSVSPAAIEKRLFENLPYLGLLSKGTNKEFSFRKASPTVREQELEIFDPAFGALGNRHFFLSTMWEAGEALHRAAADENERLLSVESMAEIVAGLPRTGTMGAILNGPVLYDSLYDGVREWATRRMGIADERGKIAEKYRKQKKTEDEIAEIVNREIQPFKEYKYGELRDQYQRALEPLRAIDGIGMVVSLGVGSQKRIKVNGILRLVPPEDEAGGGGTEE